MNKNHTDANVAELLQKVADEWQFSATDMILGTDNLNIVVTDQLGEFLSTNKNSF